MTGGTVDVRPGGRVGGAGACAELPVTGSEETSQRLGFAHAATGENRGW